MIRLLRRLFETFSSTPRRRPMKIYASYRRADSAALTGRISDHLASHFGPQSIFKDVDSIPIGADFRRTLQQEIEQCNVVLAVIGPSWTSITDEEGSRRLDNPDDFVRIELEAALQRGIPIVPVLVDGASIPSARDLPESLRAIAYRNAAMVRPDPDFHVDVDRLIKALETLNETLWETRSHAPTDKVRHEAPEAQLNPSATSTVFISHSTQDRPWVEKHIVQPLKKNGVNTWYAESAIRSASQWEREILKGMEACDWFMIIVSPRAAASEWVKDELNWAIYHRAKRIVPVICESANLWDFHIRLPRIQHVDFTTNAQAAEAQLVARIRDPE
jgi:hypothetical protein